MRPWWLLAALAACDDDRSPSDASLYDAPADIALELGTGASSYETIPPSGGRAELVHGPQGGYHIPGRYRFTGFAPDVSVSFRVTPVEGGEAINDPTNVVRRTAPRALTQVEGAWENAFVELVVFPRLRSPGEVVGRRVRWELFVRETATGRVASTSREVVIVDEVP